MNKFLHNLHSDDADGDETALAGPGDDDRDRDFDVNKEALLADDELCSL